MPKLYYPSPDEVQGAEPLNELVWFEWYQHLLVKLANTDWGRDLLLIDKHPYPVVAMGKNYVRFHLGMWDNRDHWMSDYRVGAKWGNIIRYRWLEVVKAIDRIILESILSYPSVYYRGRRLHPVGGGATTTVYPDPHPENTSVDGDASEQSANTNFATIRGASGNASTTADATLNVNLYYGSSTWSDFKRGIGLFDISSINAADSIDSGSNSFVCSAKSDPWTDHLSLVLCAPLNNYHLVAGDYDSFGTVKQAADVALSGIDAGGTNYNVFTLNAAGLSQVTTALGSGGILKHGWRARPDTDNDDPSPSSGNDMLVRILCAETTGTSKDPKLIIIHSATFVPRAMMF